MATIFNRPVYKPQPSFSTYPYRFDLYIKVNMFKISKLYARLSGFVVERLSAVIKPSKSDPRIMQTCDWIRFGASQAGLGNHTVRRIITEIIV